MPFPFSTMGTAITYLFRLAAVLLAVALPSSATESYRFGQIHCTLTLPSDWHSSQTILEQLQAQAGGGSTSFSALFVRDADTASNPAFISVQIHEATNLSLRDLADSIGSIIESPEAASLPPGVSLQYAPNGELQIDNQRAAIFARTETLIQGEVQRIGVLAQFVGREGALQLNIYFGSETPLSEDSLETIFAGVEYDKGYGYSPKSRDLVVLEVIASATRGAAVALSAWFLAMLGWKLLRRQLKKDGNQ